MMFAHVPGLLLPLLVSSCCRQYDESDDDVVVETKERLFEKTTVGTQGSSYFSSIHHTPEDLKKEVKFFSPTTHVVPPPGAVKEV